MTPITVRERRKKLEERLAKYGTMAVAAMAAAAPAQADIIHLHPTDGATTTDRNGSLFFRMTANGSSKIPFGGADLQLRNKYSLSVYITSSGFSFRSLSYTAYVSPLRGGLSLATATTGSLGKVAKLNPGARVGPSQGFSQFSPYGILAGAAHIGNWAPNGQGYLGVKFTDSGNTLYGWVDITIGWDHTITLTSWAYEDEGNPILAGDTVGPTVPEPSSFTLMALGAAGLAILRKRRRQNQVD